ncbi:Oidioi.mRNA.OKI2018_I69.chr1.g1904.t2.cds [Oikopleura dioica]|uniref:Oidioi.mRNA.OKI2018_I69.chr1.g1904.t2.cds n=1 Tax=Oikopleura dioica TaxID=34765 RepID=A0ABN7SPW7_OIKDI|nr:Oidioi.mRNA.OKI2018_I69.chr1.g1904.t2.cds [Oikopleura dioica]
MNGVRNLSESDSEIYGLAPSTTLNHDFFHRSHNSGHDTATIYCGNDEPDGCSTAEETIIVVKDSKNGEYKKIHHQLHTGFENGPGHQMKPSHTKPMSTEDHNSRPFILNFAGCHAGSPTIDSMSDSDGDDSFSPASSKTPEMIVEEDHIELEDFPEVLDEFENSRQRAPSPPKSPPATPDVEMENLNEDSNSTTFDEALQNFPATHNRTRQRKAAFRKKETITQFQSREARLEEALKARQRILEDSQCISEGAVNPLTKSLLVLSGDRHGPFVGRPNIIRPSPSLYPVDQDARVELRKWTVPSLSDLNVNLRVPPTTLQISVLDIEPAQFAADFSEKEHETPSSSRSRVAPVAGEMSRADIRRRTEEAIRRNEERKIEKEMRLQARRDKKAGLTPKPVKKRNIPSEPSPSHLPHETNPSTSDVFATPSAPRARGKKKRKGRPKRLEFAKTAAAQSVESPRKHPKISSTYETRMVDDLEDELALALRKNDIRSEDISDSLRRFSNPRRSSSPVDEIFPEASLDSDDDDSNPRNSIPGEVNYDTVVFNSILDHVRTNKLSPSKPRSRKRSSKKRNNSSCASSSSSSTTVQTKETQSNKDLSVTASDSSLSQHQWGFVAKENVISQDILEDSWRMFTKQVNFKPIDAKTTSGSPLKNQTKLRRLSKEADADAFDQKVPDRAAVLPSSSKMSCPASKSPPADIQLPDSSKILPTGMPPRRSSLRSKSNS